MTANTAGKKVLHINLNREFNDLFFLLLFRRLPLALATHSLRDSLFHTNTQTVQRML